MAKPKQPTALSPDEIELLLESIALDHLFIETLQTRHRDSLDFHDVSVWGVKSALQAAFDAGDDLVPAVHRVAGGSHPGQFAEWQLTDKFGHFVGTSATAHWNRRFQFADPVGIAAQGIRAIPARELVRIRPARERVIALAPRQGVLLPATARLGARST